MHTYLIFCERVGDAIGNCNNIGRLIAPHRQDLKGAHVLVFANKQDCTNALAPAALSAQLHLTSLKSHSWHVQPCCALTGEGLSTGLQWLTNQITGRKQ